MIEDESLSTAEQSMNILRHIALISQHGEKWKYRKLTDKFSSCQEESLQISYYYSDELEESMDTEQDNGVVKLHKDNKRARLSAVNINNGLRKKEEIHK